MDNAAVVRYKCPGSSCGELGSKSWAGVPVPEQARCCGCFVPSLKVQGWDLEEFCFPLPKALPSSEGKY